MRDIGEKIKELRLEHGMTQSELATLIGASQTSVGHWELGKRLVSQKMIVEISRVFNVTTDYLLGAPDNKRNYWELTDKDNQDIQTSLKKLVEDFSQEGSLSFSADSYIDDDDRELLLASIEKVLTHAKKMAKKKYTPKKHRN